MREAELCERHIHLTDVLSQPQCSGDVVLRGFFNQKGPELELEIWLRQGGAVDGPCVNTLVFLIYNLLLLNPHPQAKLSYGLKVSKYKPNYQSPTTAIS